MVSQCRANLKILHGINIDSGSRDQYHIHYGSRIMSQRLAEAGIRHRHEEFDDAHSDIDYRMDFSLLFLYRALAHWESLTFPVNAASPSRVDGISAFRGTRELVYDTELMVRDMHKTKYVDL
ncbi:MAG: hypothetical protein WBM28_07400 [Burkholderiales bacterium]